MPLTLPSVLPRPDIEVSCQNIGQPPELQNCVELVPTTDIGSAWASMESTLRGCVHI